MVAIATAVVGGAAALLVSGPLLILAWLLAGPVAFGLIAWFANRDTRERARALYSESPLSRILFWAAVAVSIVAVLIAALQLAFWIGRS